MNNNKQIFEALNNLYNERWERLKSVPTEKYGDCFTAITVVRFLNELKSELDKLKPIPQQQERSDVDEQALFTAKNHLVAARKRLVELRQTNTGLGMPIFAIGTALEILGGENEVNEQQADGGELDWDELIENEVIKRNLQSEDYIGYYTMTEIIRGVLKQAVQQRTKARKVKWPEELNKSNSSYLTGSYCIGWNDCIEELKRLNPEVE